LVTSADVPSVRKPLHTLLVASSATEFDAANKLARAIGSAVAETCNVPGETAASLVQTIDSDSKLQELADSISQGTAPAPAVITVALSSAHTSLFSTHPFFEHTLFNVLYMAQPQPVRPVVHTMPGTPLTRKRLFQKCTPASLTRSEKRVRAFFLDRK
jgi:hypothetical protein